MKILTVGIPSSPFEHEYKIHYSIFKSYGTAVGFSDLGHESYLMSRKLSEEKNNVILKSYKDIDIDFVKNLDLVIFTVEGGVEKSIKASKGLSWLERKKLSGSKDKLPMMIVKMGKHNWLKKTSWGEKKAYNLFDYFFAQEEGFAKSMQRDFGTKNKIFYSQMGVHKDMPKKSVVSPFFRRKNNLIYMGRLRHFPSKMPFLINLMKKLGPNYHLNILPGSFSKPEDLLDKLNDKGRNKFGPQVKENFEWLCDYFSVCKNITVLYPVEWGKHWDYLYHSDIGLDLAPGWGNKKSIAGNAKLLEYMAAGLPTVTEPGVGNVHILKKSKGGLITSKNGDLDSYYKSVLKVSESKFNRLKISKTTIDNNNWEIRARDMLKDIGLL